MSDWFKATKTVEAKGPFYDLEEAHRNGWEFSEEQAAKGWYVVMEESGKRRPVAAENFENRYEFDNADTDGGN